MPFDFNVYSSLLLPPVIHGIIFSTLLALRASKESRLSDWTLAAIVLLLTFRVSHWMLGFAGWYDSHDSFSTFMFYFPFNWGFFLGPLALLYFQSLVGEKKSAGTFPRWHWILPGLWLLYELCIFLTDLVIVPFFNGSPLPHHWNTRGELSQNGVPFITTLADVGSILSPVFYGVFIYRKYQRYRNYLSQNFSSDEIISLLWIRHVFLGLAFGLAIWGVFILAGWLIVVSYSTAWFSFAGWGLLIYIISISGYQSVIPAHFRLHFSDKKEPVQASATPNLEEENLIIDFVGKRKLYLHPDLTLQSLADELGMPSYRVSAILNNQEGRNFSRFINEFRVNHFLQLARSPDCSHLTLLGLALESGFRSKATFNRVFLEITGESPSVVLKKEPGLKF